MTEVSPKTEQPEQQEAENGGNEEQADVKPETPEKQPTSISAIHVDSQYVRLRGLPYNSTEKDVHDFFPGLAIERIKFVAVMGRPNGEGYVEFKTMEDASKAMENDRKEIKSRYIEVFTVAVDEAEFAWRPEEPTGDDSFVVRLRGLPWSCKEAEIRQFFEGLEPSPAEIVIGGTGGPRSRPSGEAFVRFPTAEAAQKAMEYNNRHMGTRYVEVFQSSMVELNREKGFSGGASGPPAQSQYDRSSGIRPLMSLDRSDSAYSGGSGAGNQQGYGGGYGGGGYDDYQRGGGGYGGGQQDYGYGGGNDYGNGGGGGGDGQDPFRIYMRGLPYDADAHAIDSFFQPIRCHSVKIGINDTGRPSGDAIAEFDNYNDMVAGMSRNNQRMGRRYVELFYTRDAPGPMRRLLWKETTGPNVHGNPQPDPVLCGRRGPGIGGPGGAPREMGGGYRGGGGLPRDSWAPQPQRSRYDGPSGPRGAPARAPRAEPWGSYGASSHQGAAPTANQYDQGGYGNSGNNGGWESYGSYGGGGGNTAAGAYPAAAYDRQREPRDTMSWNQQQQQGSYGGWGGGDQHRGGY